MNVIERIARLGDRIFDRLRHPDAFTITDDDAVDGTFDPLRQQKYAVVVTFRRNGEAVPSAVWIAVDSSGNAYVKTSAGAGKVKRLRHDSRVLIAPSNMRGKPLGPVVRGVGRVLAPAEWWHAEETLASAYGLGRTISEGLLGRAAGTAAYIAITPGPAARRFVS